MLPVDAMKAYIETAGLTGLAVAGATAPTALNGLWWYAGAVNSFPSYTNGTYVLYRHITGTAQWRISLTVGGTVVASRTAAGVAGAYTNGSGVTGTITAALDPVWPYQVMYDTAQLVVTPYGSKNDPDAARWLRYPLQLAYYAPYVEATDNKLAIINAICQRAQACFTYFDPLKGTGTGAAGLSLSGWTAQSVLVDALNFVDTIPTSGGSLLKAVTNLTLINLEEA